MSFRLRTNQTSHGAPKSQPDFLNHIHDQICRASQFLVLINSTWRVFYQVQTDNWNTVTGGPHCSFTDSSCLGMCGGSKSMKDLVHDGVGESVKVFIEKAAHGIKKSDFELKNTSSETVKLFVNQDQIVASSQSGVGATLAEE